MYKIFLTLLFLFSLTLRTNCQTNKKVKNGEKVPIACDLKTAASTVLWFRVLSNSGMQLVGSVDKQGKVVKTEGVHGINISSRQSMDISAFDKKRDSGVYSCSTIREKSLVFGSSTVLTGFPDPIATKPPPTTTPTPPVTNSTPCVCLPVYKSSDSPSTCEVVIWAPLALGCGLLFIILILIIRYCSRVRTRGCPHHHNRRPRNIPLGGPTKPGRYS
ncbi:hypothetical protein AGOR_G00050210 [Albula goreensis]|uniref:Ig-like domain-containing protein n=1 Tax=Albula goreensis TaxID=1534307 RepID=A0A8T3DXB1_9TELE|nr:hypothetical protein AGOR_G00050210 [Albula goreensis]